MAGHSKWANIKHRKDRQDKKRSSAFGKLIKEITIQARNGDPNPENNPGLAQAVERAKAANLPKDNLERAIKRATGELEGVTYEEATYEGYANDGVAVLVRSVTDNKNRAAAEIRHIFSKNGGSMAAVGSVSWLFDRKGVVVISELPDGVDHDELEFALIEAGAEEIEDQDGIIEATCPSADLNALVQAVKAQGITPDRAETTLIPKSTVHVDGAAANNVLKIVNLLDEHEDVQEVFANFDIDDEYFAKLEAEGGA
jgi:YebC/PmpR family DNA-binding regulatory protein